MNKQIIISIGREHGSAGHEIAIRLAEKLNFPIYDRNFFDEISKEKEIDTNSIEKYDEIPRKFFFSRKVNGYTNSPEENVAELQFSLLKSRAADGASFIVVGRCSDELFRGQENFLSIFITGNMEDKIAHLMQAENLSPQQAQKEIVKHDKRRRTYHDYFCKNKWGESKTYDISINSSCLGVPQTVDFLYDFIKAKFQF